MKILRDKDVRFILFSKETNVKNQPRVTLIGGHNYMNRLRVALEEHYDAEVGKMQVATTGTPEVYTVTCVVEGNKYELILARCYNY